MSTPTALYRLFGEDDALLYIGISNSFMRRWHEHSLDKDWWTEGRRATLEWFPDEESALAAEKAAIKAERPKYNRMYNEAVVGRFVGGRRRRPALAEPVLAPVEAPVAVSDIGKPLSEGLLTEGQAAAFLGMAPDELAVLRNSGDAPTYYKLAGSDQYIRYDPFDLREYQREAQGAAA